MCGITCFIQRTGRRIDESCIESCLHRANSALRHRGPDSSNLFISGRIGLGVTRLALVDREFGDQPLFNEDKSIVLVCNGEIYNHHELRGRLEALGHRFRTHADVEAIIHAYEEEPDDFLDNLRGMFAFALFDRKKNQLLIARDRFGIKPLHYYCDKEKLIFSSEIKGIFATDEVRPALHEQSIYDAFTYGFIPGEFTAFCGIQNVLPANKIIFDLNSDRIEITRYWNPTLNTGSEKKSPSRSQRAEQLSSLLKEAVAMHSMGDAPCGAYLSGGIDSTVVSTLLAGVQDHRPLKTFSMGFHDPELDESEIFRETAAKLHFENHAIDIEERLAALFPKVIGQLEQPQFSLIDVPFYCLSELAHDSGSRAVLSGDGSDELFGGYPGFVFNQINRALSSRLVGSLRRPLLERALQSYLGTREELEVVRDTLCDHDPRTHATFGTLPAHLPLWRHNSSKKTNFFRERMSDSLFTNAYMSSVGAELNGKWRAAADSDKSIYFELKSRLPNYVLHHVDRNSMAHSVEVRVPFLDDQVADFILGLTPAHKMFGLKEKYLLRRAFKAILPKQICSRRKYGFDAPGAWLWKNPNTQVQDLMSENALRSCGLFNYKQVSNAMFLLRRQAEKMNQFEKNHLSMLLTGVLSTQVLFHKYVKGASI